MGSCFPGSTSLLCSPVVCKYSLRYLVFVKFLYCIKKVPLGPLGVERTSVSEILQFKHWVLDKGLEPLQFSYTDISLLKNSRVPQN